VRSDGRRAHEEPGDAGDIRIVRRHCALDLIAAQPESCCADALERAKFDGPAEPHDPDSSRCLLLSAYDGRARLL
jgi:hypothetical protein